LARLIHCDNPGTVLEDAPGLTADEQKRGWGGVAARYYRPLLRFLSAGGRDVYAVGYDWRQDLLSLVPPLLGRLQQIHQEYQQPLVLVTHSMAGLLARAALPSGPDGLVRRVIHICQPVQGAVVMYRRMFTGVLRGPDGGWRDRPFAWVLGRTPDHFV